MTSSSGQRSEYSASAHTELIASSRPLVVMVQDADASSVFLREHSPEIVTVTP